MARFRVFFTVAFLAMLLFGCNKKASEADTAPALELDDMPVTLTEPAAYQNEDIAQDIRATFNTLGMSVANDISIKAEDSDVILSGSVASEEQKQLILDAVRKIEGINTITDDIVVRLD